MIYKSSFTIIIVYKKQPYGRPFDPYGILGFQESGFMSQDEEHEKPEYVIMTSVRS